MKALLLSDSHGNHNNMMEVIARHRNVDAIFHMGDIGQDDLWLRNEAKCPVYEVRGNCDYASTLPEHVITKFGPITIAATHGHRQIMGMFGGLDTLGYWGMENEADVVLFGHTHQPLVEDVNGILVVNPGSISRPRQYEPEGATYAILTVEDDGEVSAEIFVA